MPENNTINTYNIVIGHMPLEIQAEVALALSASMLLPGNAAQRIVANAPIAILSDLSRLQAESIKTELLKSMPPGTDLVVAPDKSEEKISRLEWPQPPRINEKSLTDFLRINFDHDLICPNCQEKLYLKTDDDKGLSLVKVECDLSQAPTSDFDKADDRLGADDDPLFAGLVDFGPIADLKAVQALNAGDTGFWMGFDSRNLPAAESNRMTFSEVEEKASASGTIRGASGLTTFMRPGPYAVVINGSQDIDVIRFTADLLGISENEAREKCLKHSLCVAKNIAREEAQSLLARLRSLKAEARIFRPS